MSCCCSCFSFLKCCDCCGGACDGKKNKPMKHLDDPFGQAPRNQGYQAPAPMMGGGLRPDSPPRFAQFEVGKNGFAVEKPAPLNEDALPPMPSWDDASKKHVMTEEEKNAVELGELDPTTGQKIPLMNGAAVTAPPSPLNGPAHNPYGAQPGQAVSGGYMGVAGDSYAQNNQSQISYDSYGQGQGQGQRQMDNPYAQDQYANAEYANAGYGRPQRGQPERQYSNSSRGQYPPSQPIRQYSNDSRPSQPRQYTDNSYQSDSAYSDPYQQPRGPSRGPTIPRMNSPALNNNSGFDFDGSGAAVAGGQGGYGQQRPAPQQQQSYNTYKTANSYRSQSPQQMETNGGYMGNSRGAGQDYRGPPPNGNGRGGPGSAYSGRGNGGREPQNWDPVQQR